MARICELFGTGVTTANNVSHSKRRTKTTQSPNLQMKRLFVPELSKTISLKLSKKALKTIEKYGGLARALANVREEYLSNTLLEVKKALQGK
jgi:large subunit ribosomal protein L28